jgi:hypothetical protein
MSDDGIRFWHAVDPIERDAAIAWLISHPEAPVVATAEGLPIAVRRTATPRMSRQGWQALIAARPDLAAVAICPDLHGEPRPLSHAAMAPTAPDPEQQAKSTAHRAKCLARLAVVFAGNLAICRACEHFRGDQKCPLIVSSCGCDRNVLKWCGRGETCPAGKWPDPLPGDWSDDDH